METKTTLSGLDTLRWLADSGARFCKVAAWNDPESIAPGKAAIEQNWPDKPLTVDQVINHLKNGGNVGLLTGIQSGDSTAGRICIFDADENFNEFCTYFGWPSIAPTLIREGAERGKVIIRVIGDLPSSKSFKHKPTDKHPFFEFLSTGRQGVVAGKHPTGADYQLINVENGIPCFTPAGVNAVCEAWAGQSLNEFTQQQQAERSEQAKTTQQSGGDGLLDRVLESWPTLRIFEHYGRAGELRTKGEETKLKGNGGLYLNGERWYCFSDDIGGGPFQAWQYCKTGSADVPKGRGFYDLLREMATAAGIPIPEHQNGRQSAPAADQNTNPESGPVLLTELGNSRRFSAAYGRLALHVKAWGWMTWNGKKWEIDETGRAIALAKKIIDSLYDEAQEALSDAQKVAGLAQNAADADQEAVKDAFDKAQKRAKDLLKWAMQSQTEQKINAMLALAESDLPACVDDFDADPWLLNCDNGVVDLRTGQLMPQNPDNRISKIAGAAYDPAAACPTWEACLQTWFAGDADLIGFIQRAIGYTLTGLTSEQALFFLYGTGKNGKSVFCEVLQALLLDYGRKTPTDTLMLKRMDEGIPNDIARLPGARAVIAAELAEGKRLNESLVKDLTGGDRIAARFLRREFFEFSPTFKIWMYGNHAPAIRGTDEGIWRRMRRVPFTVTIPEADRDPDLINKLKAELAGILAWAVRGCLDWQRQGLGMPAAVKDATDKYRAEQDALAAFLEECCLIGPSYQVTAGELYKAYKAWAEDNGENPINSRKFSQALSERGHSISGREGGTGRRLYHGLGLVTPAEEGKL